MTWLDIGNGWRNLYLLSCMLQAFTLGTLFAVHGFWMKKNRVAAFLAGVSVTPFVQYLWMLLTALVWPNAPKLVLIGFLPALAAGYLLFLVIKHRARLLTLSKRGMQTVRQIRLDRAAIISVCFAAAMAILLLPICIRAATCTVSAEADAGEYMGLALRYVEDRDTADLFTKDDAEGYYRGHSHFPSLELYMAYGLLHTSDTYGYPYDKPMFTGLGILIFYLLAAFMALCLRVVKGQWRWLMVALLLFNLIPNFVYSIGGATRDTWRVLAVLIGALAFFELRPARGWRYALSVLFALFVCFAVMSAHVVCFVIMPFVVLAWVGVVFYESLIRRDKPLQTLLKSAGVALGGAVGVLIGFSGNLWCYFKWGEFSPWRVLTSYTDAPWYATYMDMEYKLEETTTQLNFWEAKYDIIMAYASPVGLWGLRLALIALIAGLGWLIWKRRQKPMDLTNQRDHSMATLALLTLLTLAPMTGLLDSSLYSFSGAFISLPRYTLQWYFFAAAMIAAVGAYIERHWPEIIGWMQSKLHKRTLPKWALRIPAYICVILCVCWFAEGIKVTGYSASFYRIGSDWLTDDTYAQDNFIIDHYSMLLEFAELLEDDQNILISRESYQYPLHSRALLLTANANAPILNLTLEEIPDALAAQNIVALVTAPDFWDGRFYAETTLSEYLNALPEDQIFEDDAMRIYIIDADLAAEFQTVYDGI